MPKKSGLSIEVFRDYHSINPESLSIAPLIASISGIAKITGKIDVLDTQRYLDVSLRPTKTIVMDDYFIDAGTLPADLNVVLTDRKLTYRNLLLCGIAHTLPNRPVLGTRVAIVSTYKNELVAATGDHEIGHNLNLPHCDDDECTMSEYFTARYDDFDQDYADIYCEKCTDKLAKNVDKLRKKKIGKNVSKRVLFPSFHSQYPDDPFFKSSAPK